MNFSNIETANSWAHQTVCACGECSIKFGFIVWNLIHRLNFIKVEWKFSRNATIDASFQICCPILTEDIFATSIFFTNTSNTWIDRFATIYVLDSCFPEEKVHIIPNVKWSDEIWFWKLKIEWKMSELLFQKIDIKLSFQQI